MVVVPTVRLASNPAMTGPTASRAGTTNAVRLPDGLPPCTARRTNAPAPNPVSTTAAVSSGAPPMAATGRNTPLGCPNATLPHGKPPKGARAINASAATQTAAPQIGAAGSREAIAIPAPATATTSALTVASATHGSGPTNSPLHDSIGAKQPSSKAKPYP